MKHIKTILCTLCVMAMFSACSDSSEDSEDEVKVYPVEKLSSPVDGDNVILDKGSSLSFSWEAARIEGKTSVSYILKFDDEKGDFSSPKKTYKVGSTNLKVTHAEIDQIAGLAGIALAETGVIKWTVSVVHGEKQIESGSFSKLTVKRLAKPKNEIPVNLYIYGNATEAGESLGEALEFRKISNGVFEIFTRIEADKAFKLVNNREGSEIDTYFVDKNTISIEEKESKINKSAIYRISLNFNNKVASFSEITDFSFFICYYQRKINLEYIGKGQWSSKYLFNYIKASWGNEGRYKFRMNESKGGEKSWVTASNGDSNNMKESTENTQWGGEWGVKSECDKKWIGITVNMSGPTYTHNITPADPEFDKINPSWGEVANNSSSSFITGFWNNSKNHFNNSVTGTINQYDYWPEAHAMDVIIDAYQRTGDAKYKQVIYNFYEGVKQKNGNKFKNSFYDDMAWHGLTHMRAFEATNDSRYEQSAKDLWKWIQVGWDKENGGIKWNDQGTVDGNSTGVPSTGPSTIIAIRRWVKYGDIESEKTDGQNNLEWAKKMYLWMRENRHDIATGGVYDDFDNREGAWTYNTGTFLGAAMELYDVTKGNWYLEDAIKTADWTLKNLSLKAENTFVLSDWAEQTDHDVNLFKGIFIRYFTRLIMNPDLPAAKRNEYISFMKYNAKTLWMYGSAQDKNVILYNYAWYFKPKESFLRGQTSGCMLMEAMALLEKEGYI